MNECQTHDREALLEETIAFPLVQSCTIYTHLILNFCQNQWYEKGSVIFQLVSKSFKWCHAWWQRRPPDPVLPSKVTMSRQTSPYYVAKLLR
jgi:hypothetical protein